MKIDILKDFREKYNKHKDEFKGNISLQDQAFVESYILSTISKVLQEVKEGLPEERFVMMVNTDVKWFHEVVLPRADEIRFIKGRLKFGEHNNTAPFANMLVIFR